MLFGRTLGNVILVISAVLAVIALPAGLHLVFADYRDGASHESALIAIALAAAIIFVGFMAKRILKNDF